MRLTSAKIPTELIYVSTKTPRILKLVWEDNVDDNDEIPTEEVFPTFPVDATNEQTLATARKWAGTGYTELKRPNDPIQKLKIYGLDYRGNGGRAWKCADEQGHYFDLREDIMLDLMRTEGVSPGGYLNGSYVWVRINAEMKLVRVGSELHKAAVEADERNRSDSLKTEDMVPFHMYEKKNGDKVIYLGRFKGLKAAELSREKQKEIEAFNRFASQYEWNQKYHGHRSLNSYEGVIPGRKISYKEKTCHVFLDLKNLIPYDKRDNSVEYIKAFLVKPKNFKNMDKYNYLTRSLDTRLPANLVKDCGSVDFEFSVVDFIKSYIYEQSIKQITTPKPGTNRYSRVRDEHTRLNQVADTMFFGTMVPETEDLKEAEKDEWATLALYREAETQ